MTKAELKALLVTWLATNGNWAERFELPEYKIQEVPIVYGPRRLKAKWSPESAQDLSGWYKDIWHIRFTQNLPKVQDYLNHVKN